MTAEEKLKQLILTKYRSVREFTQMHEIPYSTVATIWQKGIKKTSITTMIKVCQALNISTDELIAGRITFVDDPPEPTRIEDYILQLQQKLQNTENLTLNDQPVDEAQINSLVKSLEVIIEIEKRKTK